MRRTGFKPKARGKGALYKPRPPLRRTPFKRKPKEKKPKKPSRSNAKLKKQLDILFSKYIRAIYPKVCYTCEQPKALLQNGHYISRQYLATRWSVHNCRPQCWGCNGYGKGQPLIFEEKLKKEYGNDFVEKMKASRHEIIILSTQWYEEQIAHYKQKLIELES